MGALVFLLVFFGGWIVLGRYWWRTARHRVLAVLGAGALCFVVGAGAGAAIDGAFSGPTVTASTPLAMAPAVAHPSASPPMSAASAPPATRVHKVAAAAPAPAATVHETVAAANDQAPPNMFAQRAALEKKALSGDYQAQRNLAYLLGHEQPTNTMQACAWRIVILGSGSEEVDDSDLMNKRADCDRKLAADGLYAAGMRAVAIGEKIDARRK